MSLDHAFDQRERIHILVVREELEGSWEITVIVDVEHPVSGATELDLAEMHGLDRETNIVAFSMTNACKGEVVAPDGCHFVLGAGCETHY